MPYTSIITYSSNLNNSKKIKEVKYKHKNLLYKILNLGQNYKELKYLFKKQTL